MSGPRCSWTSHVPNTDSRSLLSFAKVPCSEPAEWVSAEHGYRCDRHGRHLRVMARGSDWRRLVAA